MRAADAGRLQRIARFWRAIGIHHVVARNAFSRWYRATVLVALASISLKLNSVQSRVERWLQLDPLSHPSLIVQHCYACIDALP